MKRIAGALATVVALFFAASCGAATGGTRRPDAARVETTPPSCAPGGAGMTNCGAASESCCTSLEVAGGEFDRYSAEVTTHSDKSGDGGKADEIYPATVSRFRLDKYEVTVGRFRQFVSAWNGGYRPPTGSGKHTHLNGGRGLVDGATDLPDGGAVTYETGWQVTDERNVAPTDANLSSCLQSSTWTHLAATHENLPINCVSWKEAYAFCVWDGGFLPSEAESEYAAAGGSQQRKYPWGGTDPGKSNEYAIYDCNYERSATELTCTGPENIAPVGTATRGAGRWGQLDLAGNVLEWTLDRDCSSAPAPVRGDTLPGYVSPCTDCACLAAGAPYRVLRGGDYRSDASYLNPTFRHVFPPARRLQLLGLRCARTPG
jgi:formylglycine-generating enzyme